MTRNCRVHCNYFLQHLPGYLSIVSPASTKLINAKHTYIQRNLIILLVYHVNITYIHVLYFRSSLEHHVFWYDFHMNLLALLLNDYLLILRRLQSQVLEYCISIYKCLCVFNSRYIFFWRRYGRC